MLNKKEHFWKLLKGKYSFGEIMEMLGEKKDINVKTIDFFVISHFLQKHAYSELVKMGEIDNSMVFNFATKEYENISKDTHGDIGAKGNKNYIFNGTEWIFIN